MAKSRMDVTAFVGKLLKEDDADVLKEGVQVLAQAFMEAEVSAQVGARAYERSSERTACRNGYRTRTWDTRVGTIELKIPNSPAAATSPLCWSPAGGPRRPCTRWWSRPTSRGSPPAKSTTSPAMTWTSAVGLPQ